MSINIPSGSANPIGHKMPQPGVPPPAPSEENKQAIQQALHDRDAPRHLVGDESIVQKKGLGSDPNEGGAQIVEPDEVDKTKSAVEHMK